MPEERIPLLVFVTEREKADIPDHWRARNEHEYMLATIVYREHYAHQHQDSETLDDFLDVLERGIVPHRQHGAHR